MVAEYGGEGESFVYEMELRILADIGLVSEFVKIARSFANR